MKPQLSKGARKFPTLLIQNFNEFYISRYVSLEYSVDDKG
jgi:hypothetical protein